MSLTNEIYLELLDGLEKGLDWQQFLAKHGASKGPLYNALGRVITGVEANIRALSEKKVEVQEELGQAQLKLDSLDQNIKEAERNVARLEDRKNTLDQQTETLGAKLAEKIELTKQISDLERHGFDAERLRQLQEALREIGMKHGLKGKETVRQFFADLEDYEVVLGAELRLKGLQTQIETKKLETENWQAKEEALRRKHNDLKEAIDAVHALLLENIEVSQIIAWHQILNRFETAVQFEKNLAQYADITKLLSARKEEADSYDLRLRKAQSQVEALEKERAKIEAAIKTLKVTGVKELKAMSQAAGKQLKELATREIDEIRAVGRNARAQFDSRFAQYDELLEGISQASQKLERLKQELEKYELLQETLKSHVAASEEEK